MKNKLLTILAVALVATCFPACNQLRSFTSGASTTLSASNSTAVVVNAEKALRESKDTIDTFLHLEYNHRDFIKKNVPSVHAGAEALRRKAPDALIAANKIKNTFKHNRTAENEANLLTAVATVTQIAGEAKAYTQQINSSTP